MRIIIDARLYGIYHRGLGRYLKELLANLAKLDKTNTYLILINPLNPEQPIDLGSNFNLIKAPWRQYSLAEQLFLPVLIKKLKADLVHFPHFNVPWFAPKPFLITVHDLIINHFPSSRATTLPKWLYQIKLLSYKLVVQRALKRSQKVIAISQATADDIADYYPFVKNKIKVIYPGLTATTTAAKIDNLPANYFLVVGAAYPHKNLEKLLMAFQRTLTTLPNYKLIIVGRTDFFMERLKDYAGRLGLGQQVIFWGEASEAELTTLYQKTSGYILPSLGEGFGFPPLEALRQGSQIATADIPVMHEVLGDLPIYFDPRSEVSMALALTNLSKNGPTTDLSIKNILNKYNWAQTVSSYKEIYQNLDRR